MTCGRPLEGFECADCNVNTAEVDEYYMLRNDVWPLPPGPQMLCIGCAEGRIGRRLTPADFTGCLLNTTDILGDKSERLRDRLGLA